MSPQMADGKIAPNGPPKLTFIPLGVPFVSLGNVTGLLGGLDGGLLGGVLGGLLPPAEPPLLDPP